ncbi:MAG: hypothetical protein IJI59_13165 [Clostridia bacterium]|nr:hypothetical protein [Clostridia bacterium]
MLKRMISLVLIAVIYAFCCAPAVAEESESEILFRNIPWGSSVSEVQALLKAELGEEITLKKGEPLYYMDRPELGCYSGYNSDELDYYEAPGNGLHFQNVYVDEIHLFFRDDRLVQAGYYFRTDPNNVGQMSEALDAQYGPHTLSVSKQITDVDLYTWEKDGRIITLEEIQIEAFLVGYYTHVVIVYSNQ